MKLSKLLSEYVQLAQVRLEHVGATMQILYNIESGSQLVLSGLNLTSNNNRARDSKSVTRLKRQRRRPGRRRTVVIELNQ